MDYDAHSCKEEYERLMGSYILHPQNASEEHQGWGPASQMMFHSFFTHLFVTGSAHDMPDNENSTAAECEF